MSHHSDKMEPQELPESLRRMFEGFELGATGHFPEGKLVPSDEGEIQIAVTNQAGKVLLAFGKEIAWIGFTPQQADEIADSLRQHAENARATRGLTDARHSQS